jgi:hypothetical protein
MLLAVCSLFSKDTGGLPQLVPMTACKPSFEMTMDEMSPSHDGKSLAAICTPLTVNACSTREALSNKRMIPSGDTATMSALSIGSFRKNRPRVMECKSTPFV